MSCTPIIIAYSISYCKQSLRKTSSFSITCPPVSNGQLEKIVFAGSQYLPAPARHSGWSYANSCVPRSFAMKRRCLHCAKTQQQKCGGRYGASNEPTGYALFGPICEPVATALSALKVLRHALPDQKEKQNRFSRRVVPEDIARATLLRSLRRRRSGAYSLCQERCTVVVAYLNPTSSKHKALKPVCRCREEE